MQNFFVQTKLKNEKRSAQSFESWADCLAMVSSNASAALALDIVFSDSSSDFRRCKQSIRAESSNLRRSCAVRRFHFTRFMDLRGLLVRIAPDKRRSTYLLRDSALKRFCEFGRYRTAPEGVVDGLNGNVSAAREFGLGVIAKRYCALDGAADRKLLFVHGAD